jgi:type IV secretory pathway VirB10-like protein
MKSFNQNQGQAVEAVESSIRPFVLRRLTRRNQTIAGAAILAIIVLHFAAQFIFFQSEKPSPEIEAISRQSVEIESESEPNLEIETQSEARKPDVVAMPEKAAPNIQPEPKIAPSQQQTLIRKKEPRESKAERLRRAERLLTGV